jgi:Flp pilus assembly pilin Flp
VKRKSGRDQSGLVSIVVIVILLTMGNQILNVFSNVVAALGA